MRALVKFTFSLFALVLLLTACRRDESQLSPDDQTRKKLAGIWVCDKKFPSGRSIHSTTTILPDGSYLSSMEISGRTNGPRVVSVEGTFQVKDGFLIETPTKCSETNVPVAVTSRARIVRIDDRELVLDGEQNSSSVSATSPAVFRKQTQ